MTAPSTWTSGRRTERKEKSPCRVWVITGWRKVRAHPLGRPCPAASVVAEEDNAGLSQLPLPKTRNHFPDQLKSFLSATHHKAQHDDLPLLLLPLLLLLLPVNYHLLARSFANERDWEKALSPVRLPQPGRRLLGQLEQRALHALLDVDEYVPHDGVRVGDDGCPSQRLEMQPVLDPQRWFAIPPVLDPEE